MAGIVSQLLVQQYVNDLEDASGVFLTEYNGLTVDQLAGLRQELRKTKSHFRVMKNKLAKRAFEESSIIGLNEQLQGSTAVVVVRDSIVDAAKVVKKYEKDFDVFNVKAGFTEGAVLSREDIGELASIPSREVLIAKLLGCLNSPISGIVSVLGAVPRKLVYAFNAVKHTKDD